MHKDISIRQQDFCFVRYFSTEQNFRSSFEFVKLKRFGLWVLEETEFKYVKAETLLLKMSIQAECCMILQNFKDFSI